MPKIDKETERPTEFFSRLSLAARSIFSNSTRANNINQVPETQNSLSDKIESWQ